jgi:hypothetical protein
MTATTSHWEPAISLRQDASGGDESEVRFFENTLMFSWAPLRLAAASTLADCIHGCFNAISAVSLILGSTTSSFSTSSFALNARAQLSRHPQVTGFGVLPNSFVISVDIHA